MSWYQIAAIIAESRDTSLAEESNGPPTVCPHDGTLLISDRHGTLRCPWNGYEWPEF